MHRETYDYSPRYDIRITNLPVSYERAEQDDAKNELKRVLLKFSRNMGNILEPFDLLMPRGEAVGYLKMAAESIVPGVLHLLQGAELTVWGAELQFTLVDVKHRSNMYNSAEWRACRETPSAQHHDRLLHAQLVLNCWVPPSVPPAKDQPSRPASANRQLSTPFTVPLLPVPAIPNAYAITRMKAVYSAKPSPSSATENLELTASTRGPSSTLAVSQLPAAPVYSAEPSNPRAADTLEPTASSNEPSSMLVAVRSPATAVYSAQHSISCAADTLKLTASSNGTSSALANIQLPTTPAIINKTAATKECSVVLSKVSSSKNPKCLASPLSARKWTKKDKDTSKPERAATTRLQNKRSIAQSSSLEPLDKHMRDTEDEQSEMPKEKIQTLKKMVLTLQKQFNELVDRLDLSDDTA